MTRIVLGMSGGVDSTAAAILLKEQGYEVTAVYMVLGHGSVPEHLEALTRKLDVPLHIMHGTLEDFRKTVISRFMRDTSKGLTPNPCVYCNSYFKFGVMWSTARRFDADLMATGHYARFDGHWIRRARDRRKDQSYFLWGVRNDVRPRIVTPLGDITRQEAEELVRSRGIEIPQRPSVDVCFAPDGMAKYLKSNGKLTPGRIRDVDDRVLGHHDGVELFTIGQRKGLSIGGVGRIFVLKKQGADVIVGPRESLRVKSMDVSDVIWSSSLMAPPRRCLVQYRYRTPPVLCRIQWLGGNSVRVFFEEEAYAVAPGQAAVFYGDGTDFPNDLQLGGGWIVSSDYLQ